MGLKGKFQAILLKSSLLNIYRSIIRSGLEYADIIYEQA